MHLVRGLRHPEDERVRRLSTGRLNRELTRLISLSNAVKLRPRGTSRGIALLFAVLLQDG